ncbi:MAG: hypothetical protein L0G99_13370, partial [Propionibacteriales bacterium]|nr:hypothetical protein [Propionibacteriales bacterium]
PVASQASAPSPAAEQPGPAPRYTAKRSAGRGGRLLPASRRSPSERPGAAPQGRARIGVVLGAVAATLAVILAIGYAVFALRQGDGDTVATQPTGAVTSAATPSSEPETLSEQRLLTDTQAEALDPKATWSVTTTQTGINDNSPVATCLSKPTENETPAEKTMIRVLTGTGARTLTTLQQADLYPTKDEAADVFGERSKPLGGCMVDKVYLDSAVLVSNLSNQAIGVTVTSNESEPSYHTVLMVQVGRMLNVFASATTDKPVSQAQMAKMAAGVVNTQCTVAVGLCADKPAVMQVVPPIGGDAPGLPVAADIPVLKGQTGRWAPADVTQAHTTTGTSCEQYDFAKADGPTARLGRTYILEDDDTVKSTFGIDEVILTMRNQSEATKLAEELRGNLRKCGARQPTAKVSGETTFDSVGAQRIKIQGTSFKIRQNSSETEAVTYRVTVSTAGTKVIYTFLPLEPNVDFTDKQWQDFNIRAGQRATQIG